MSARIQLLFLITTFLLAPLPALAETVAWYSLDDGSASDVTGNGNHGLILGQPRSVDGIVGRSLEFSGGAHRVAAPIATGFAGSEVGFSAFVRFDAMPIGSAELVTLVLGTTRYQLALDPRGRAAFEISSAGDRSEIRSTFAIQPAVWTSIIGSYDGTEARLYVHGELAAVATLPGFMVESTGRISFGSGVAARIDEVRVGDGAVIRNTACNLALKAWHQASQTCNSTVTDITAELGLLSPDHKHFGATLVDVNRDGWLDFYVVNGGSDPDVPVTETGVCPPLDGVPDHDLAAVNQFYLNNGDGTFGPDTAGELGLADFWNAMRHVWADYDGDGDFDVYSHNFLVSSLYEMVDGPDPMRFADVSGAANLRVCLTGGTGASWVDVDNDGDLDILLVEYDPQRPAAEHLNLMYLNDGDGTFTEVTADSGFAADDNNPMGFSFGDYDNDGDQDVFLTNSHEAPARLYRNEGVDPDSGVAFFDDVAPTAGVAVIGEPHKGFGSAWGDYDNDGWLDLLYVREGDSRLFRNRGDGTFTDVTDLGGLELSGLGYKFQDGGFADLDNDGWLDIVLANRVQGAAGANLLFLSNRDGTWREISARLGMQTPLDAALGFVPGDIDNDGDLDFVFINHETEQVNHFYRNEERGNNWVQIRLHGTASNLDAIGARIELGARLQDGESVVTQMREVTAGTGFFSDYPRTQTFGLGKASRVVWVRVTWPSGIVQELSDLAINTRHEVHEPAP